MAHVASTWCNHRAVEVVVRPESVHARGPSLRVPRLSFEYIAASLPAARLRRAICRGVEHLGIALDDDRNAAGAPIIGQGRCEVHVIRTDEERMIARHARRLVPSSGSQT
jgi:hypothetical protein